MHNLQLRETFFYAFTFPIIAALIHYFYRECLKQIYERKVYIISYIVYCAISIGIYLMNINGAMALIINILLVFILSLFYKGAMRWKVISSAILIGVIILSDALVQSLLEPCLLNLVIAIIY